MEISFKSKKIKYRTALMCLMLMGSILNLNAITSYAEGDVVVVHVGTPKSTTNPSKPRRAPMRKTSNTVYLEFLQDVDNVTIVVKETGQMSKTFNEGNLLSGTMIPFSIKNDEGSLLIEVYSDGVFIESFVIQ